MKIKIEVMLRDAILDPQGNTIKKSLNSLGFKNVKSVRQGKLIEKLRYCENPHQES